MVAKRSYRLVCSYYDLQQREIRCSEFSLTYLWSSAVGCPWAPCRRSLQPLRPGWSPRRAGSWRARRDCHAGSGWSARGSVRRAARCRQPDGTRGRRPEETSRRRSRCSLRATGKLQQVRNETRYYPRSTNSRSVMRGVFVKLYIERKELGNKK